MGEAGRRERDGQRDRPASLPRCVAQVRRREQRDGLPQQQPGVRSDLLCVSQQERVGGHEHERNGGGASPGAAQTEGDDPQRRERGHDREEAEPGLVRTQAGPDA